MLGVGRDDENGQTNSEQAHRRHARNLAQQRWLAAKGQAPEPEARPVSADALNRMRL